MLENTAFLYNVFNEYTHVRKFNADTAQFNPQAGLYSRWVLAPRKIRMRNLPIKTF